MLEPHSRRLLADALRPPDGYTLDTAIGTTYSLDLQALLNVPLSFPFFDWEGTAAPDKIDPLALLEALRQHGERIHVFCQAGQIHVPKQYHALYSDLEGSVIQVRPPHGRGVFHAKTWLLRFASDEGVRYRLLVPSRNLTFDRSWDSLLVLDGVLTGRKNAIGRNRPLGDFFAALPGMAVGPLSGRAREAVERAQHEVRRVDFELPEPFEDLVFWPLGIGDRDLWPFEEPAQRVLIVSPFLTEECLERIPGDEGILISQPEDLAKLSPAGRDKFAHVYVLNNAADPVPAEAGDPDGEPSLSGLHAKLYLTEAGWNASVWTGSANATTAAFGANVELLVQLTGKKSRCGIDTVLGREGDNTSLLGLRLLQEFQPPDTLEPLDPAQAEIERALLEVRTRLASASLALYTEQGDSGDEYSLTLRTEGGQAIDLPERTRVRCQPITMSDTAAVELPERLVPGQAVAVFRSISFEAVSAYMALVRSAGRDEPYWRQVLTYCTNGCRQAVLDEYAHVLWDAGELTGEDMSKAIGKLADAVRVTLQIRTTNHRVDIVSVSQRPKAPVNLMPESMRARFAMRFGTEAPVDDKGLVRHTHVKDAFNSPFWPFVLATTSVGQEGLDFHRYCHAVVHWDLPSNPVDLEQREGRVHRYKGHAVRKNVALVRGPAMLRDLGRRGGRRGRRRRGRVASSL